MKPFKAKIVYPRIRFIIQVQGTEHLAKLAE